MAILRYFILTISVTLIAGGVADHAPILGVLGAVGLGGYCWLGDRNGGDR